MARVWNSFVAAVLAAGATSCTAAPVADCLAGKLDAGLSVSAAMEAAGLDTRKPRLVTQLFLGDDKRLAALKQRLDSSGWPATADAPGRLLASATTPTDGNWVKSNTPTMCGLAAEFEVDWDGWDVDVAADQVQQRPQ